MKAKEQYRQTKNNCSNKMCKFEYEMHTGVNVCPECGERTFVPAEEENSRKKEIIRNNQKTYIKNKILLYFYIQNLDVFFLFSQKKYQYYTGG